MCEKDCGCSAEKKDEQVSEFVMRQPPMVWYALVAGFVAATLLRK